MNPEDYFLDLDSSQVPGAWAAPLIKMNWSGQILDALTRIELNPVGVLLLREFQRYRLWVKIRPYLFDDASKSKLYCNAASFGNVTVKQSRRYGTVVDASLERFADGTSCAKRSAKQGGAVAEAHERLFHELVHALRYVTETSVYKQLDGGLKGFESVEEFIAVMVTNIYASAGGKSVLRKDWKGHHRLGERFDDSFEYFRLGSMTYPIVADLYAANQTFCLLLANIKARFNPIRAFVEDSARARRYAEGDIAKLRDGTLTPAQLMRDP